MELYLILLLGITLGLMAGLEIARRAYRDTASMLSKVNLALAEKLP
jgi:hypothetical protein